MTPLNRVISVFQATVTITLVALITVFLLNAVAYLSIKMRHEQLSPLSQYGLSTLRKCYDHDFTDEQMAILMRETWQVPFTYEAFVQFKEQPQTGRYVNISPHGFRIGPDQGPWPPKPGNVNIFVFGGSTAFCYGLPDHQTIGARLQARFTTSASKKPAKVYNFGRGHYYSSQERVLFETLLLREYVPDLAVFIDGFNDLGLAQNDEPVFTEDLRSLMDE